MSLIKRLDALEARSNGRGDDWFATHDGKSYQAAVWAIIDGMSEKYLRQVDADKDKPWGGGLICAIRGIVLRHTKDHSTPLTMTDNLCEAVMDLPFYGSDPFHVLELAEDGAAPFDRVYVK